LFEGDDAPVPVRATGHVREVLYLGERTRYAVRLDGGDELTVVEQNMQTAEQARAKRGLPVRLAWDPRFEQVLEETSTTKEET